MIEVLVRLFDSWETHKVEEDDATMVAYVFKSEILLLQDDAIQAAELLDEQDEVVFCGEGCFWGFPASYRAFYFKRLERMGKRIKYTTVAIETPVKAEKIRLQEFATVINPEDRNVDKPTGRVYIGRAPMGTFWWCPKTRMVYMRRNDNIWVGQFCTKEQWPGIGERIKERLPIPA